MTRYTKPDRYSKQVKENLRQVRAGEISWETFAMMMGLVWKLRGNA